MIEEKVSSCEYSSRCPDIKKLIQLRKQEAGCSEDLEDQLYELCNSGARESCLKYQKFAREKTKRIRYEHEHQVDSRGCT